MRLLLPAALLLAAPALAQGLSPEQDAGFQAIYPILAEVSPQDGAVLASCVVSVAQPPEVAQMAAAGGPSDQLGALVSQIIARPETLSCIQATLGR